MFVSSSYCKSVNVQWSHYLSADENYFEAVQKALFDAKLEALRKAGIEEHIIGLDVIILSEDDRNKYSDKSKNIVHKVLNGRITKWKYVVQPQKGFSSELNCYFIFFEIQAKIKLYKTEADQSFELYTQGIKPIYEHEEYLNIKIKSSKDAYLRVFFQGKDSAFQIYPLNDNGKIKKSAFLNIDYVQCLHNGDDIGTLLIVATKREYPLLLQSSGRIDNNYLLRWISNIELAQKNVLTHPVLVIK